MGGNVMAKHLTKHLCKINGVLGADLGTQELTLLLMDTRGKVRGVGVAGGYPMVYGLPDGYREQRPKQWEAALVRAMKNLRNDLAKKGLAIGRVLCICLTGQMHGEVGLGFGGKEAWETARLWCDPRNKEESEELTGLFNFKVPIRMTIARWLWTIRNQPDMAKRCAGLTTPAGWLTFVLCGNRVLGMGEASGMFPIDPATGSYDAGMIQKFNRLTRDAKVPPINSLLPTPMPAGSVAGRLSARGAKMLGLPEGIPIAPPEGDQPAALAGSFIARPGDVSLSVGTSMCANAVAPAGKVFKGVHPSIDHWCTADGKPLLMAWIKCGTTFMNWLMDVFAIVLGLVDREGKPLRAKAFGRVMPLLAGTSIDCGGIQGLPLMETEPCTGFNERAVAFLAGMNLKNPHPANLINAAFMAALFNVRLGLEELRRQGYPLERIIVTGGIVKSKGHFGPLIANALGIPAACLEAAEEGTAFGGGLLALFCHARKVRKELTWEEFLEGIRGRQQPETFIPNPDKARAATEAFARHKELLGRVEPLLINMLA